MNALRKRKWDGVLSLVWAIGGLLPLMLSGFHSDSPTLRFLILFVAWWGVALLLAVTGLRSGSLPSVLTGLVTIVLFIGFLWIDLTPHHGSHRAWVTEAKTQLANFKTALDAFKSDNGFYPTGLEALVKQPSGATNWRGPYMDQIPKDPWGRDYIYNYPAKQMASGSAFDLRSLGPPGKNSPVRWSPDLTHPMRESVEAQPGGAANGSQPVRSETNQTSGAAGSRR
jgi:general secretion pathway protein G